MQTMSKRAIKERAFWEVVGILDKLGANYFLTHGSALGLYRDKELIEHDKDVDFGLMIEDLLPHSFKIMEELRDGGYVVEAKIHPYDKVRVIQAYKDGEIVDIFGYFKVGSQIIALGGCENMYVYDRALFDDMATVTYKDHEFKIPSPETYFTTVYGDWKTPRRESFDKNEQPLSEKYVKEIGKKQVWVYAAGVFDYLHYGHVRYLENSKSLGDILVVGLLTDDGAEKYKPRPILNYAQRYETIKSLRCIDYIVEQDDTDPTNTLNKLKYEKGWIFDILCRGDDYKGVPPGTEFIEKNGGKVVKIPYTQEISSTIIKEHGKTVS